METLRLGGSRSAGTGNRAEFHAQRLPLRRAAGPRLARLELETPAVADRAGCRAPGVRHQPPAPAATRALGVRTQGSARLEPIPSRLPRHRLADDQSSSAADRKSTRLNSSHVRISYAVFCLKK